MCAGVVRKSLMKSAATSRKGTFVLFFALAALWLVLDQATKAMAEDALFSGNFVDALPGVFGFELVHNIGAAWGIFGGATIALVALSVVICALIVVYLAKMWKTTDVFAVIGASLVFAGGLGNMIDRLAFGYVRDFISLTFINFPVFNIADIGVTCGVVLFAIGLIRSGEEA